MAGTSAALGKVRYDEEMETWQPIGKHRIRIEGDVIFVRAQGDITGPEVLTLCEHMLKIQQQYGWVFEIVDAHSAGAMSGEARRQNADWYRGHQLDVEAVVFGSSFVVRTLFSLFINAIRLLGSRQARVYFVASEAEARALVAQRRQQKIAATAAS